MSDTPAPQSGAVDNLYTATFAAYGRRRLAYYNDRKTLLPKLLQKDVLMYAARGVRDSDGFIDAAFSAHESSSEETMWGHAWQEAISKISTNTVGGGDLRTERDGTLWIIQVKTGVEQNSAAEAQDLRLLKTKLRNERDHHPGRHGVKAMLGIVRGAARSEWRQYRATSEANKDIDDFQYQYLVGSAFLSWISTEFDANTLMGHLTSVANDIEDARRGCLESLKLQLRADLAEAGLGLDIGSVLALQQRSTATQ